jgi:aconitate hydratase
MGEGRESIRSQGRVSRAVDAAGCLSTFAAAGRSYRCYSLAAAERQGLPGVARLPFTLKIVLENLLRQHASDCGRQAEIDAVIGRRYEAHVQFRPARVMMDDTAGLPLIGELAAMRDAAKQRGAEVDLAVPVDFIVDHSVIADHTGTPDALKRNMALEMRRNAERFRLLRWAEQAFPKLRVVPPGRGICHQINLEYLAQVVCVDSGDEHALAYADTLVGIDSHTPMINGLGVVGWGTSGIEGLAAALGEPVTIRVPRVVGCELTGALRAGVTATDLVLTLTRKLREIGVVGSVIEYLGPGVTALSAQDRATVANMAPEAGATMCFFPIDAATIQYLRATGRPQEHVALVEAYARAQGLWFDAEMESPRYDERLTFDLDEVEPSLSGPRLPHQRIRLAATPAAFLGDRASAAGSPAGAQLNDGDIVLAAITSCTNTSNPALMIGAGLLARNAARRGLEVKPWVKTSLSPGSRVVADYLKRSGLQDALDALGFHVAGFGCMTCVGFSGPLRPDIAAAVRDRGVRAVAVYSGNRNYEGRAHPLIRSSFLASPPLVVAYALCGTILRDLTSQPIGEDGAGRAVFLSDIWPDAREVHDLIASHVAPELFARSYADVFEGSADWRDLDFPTGPDFAWNADSTFIQRPRTFSEVAGAGAELSDLDGARVLAIYGDMVTTEHLSPMGVIPEGSPAAAYLASCGVAPGEFVSYAARRLNEEVMTRGALASPHLLNELTPEAPGGMTRHASSGTIMTIFDAAERYRREGVPLVLIAGEAFGAGSSRDWSAKGPAALGVKAIVAGSYERIYRSNLLAAGVLPLEFPAGTTRKSLGLDGRESVALKGLAKLAPRATLTAVFTRASGAALRVPLVACVDTVDEVEQIRHAGLLRMLLRRRMQEKERRSDR